MKSKKVYKFVTLSLMLVLATALIPNTFVSSELQLTDSIITEIIVYFEGDQPSTAMQFKFSMNLETYNSTVPSSALELEGFAEENLASNDLKTDGITRTFSDSYLSTISGLTSAVGLYQALKGIPEDHFSQYATKKDSSVHAFSSLETYAKMINDSISADYPTLSYLNFTCAKAYATVTVDKASVDAFFTSAKAKATYGEIAESYSTNKQMITTLLDDVFGQHCFDFVYSPVNETGYATDWSVQKELRAVLGGNASDDSLDGATKTASMRNLAFGYLGQRIVPDSVIEAQAENTEIYETGQIFGFEQTATTYSFNLDVFSDLTSSGIVDWDYNTLFSIFQPATEKGTTVSTLYQYLLCGLYGLGVACVCGVIALIATKDKDKKVLVTLSVVVLSFIITFILALVITAKTVVV